MPSTEASREGAPLSCPSGQPGMEDVRIFGVLGGTAQAPRVGYLKREAEVTTQMLQGLGGIDPAHVFRFSAKCEESRCAQFANGRCGLGKRIAEQLAPVVDALPSCQIRPTCRWHHEEGNAACFRCPQVVTLVEAGEGALARAAVPVD